MRTTQQNRRIQNSIMKSPSPDIANRNIIKDTKPPMEDVLRFLQKKSQSKSPRISQLSQSARFLPSNPNQVQLLRQRIRELEVRVNQLMMENQRLRRMGDGLGDVDGSLMRMRQTIKSQDGSRLATPRSQDRVHKTLEQMQERLMKMLDQNNRLGSLLQDKQYLNQTLQSQNKRLKLQLEFSKYQANPSMQSSTLTQFPSQSTQPQDLTLLRNFYEGRIEPEMKRSQTEWMNRMQELAQRMNRIQQNQQYIENELVRKSQITTATPIKNISQGSNNKTDEQNNSGGVRLPQSTRPFDSMTMRNSRQYEDTIKQLQNRNKTVQRENQTCRKRIIQLQSQLKKAKEITNFDIRQNTDNQQYLKKVRELENQLDSKSFEISNLDRDLRSTKQDYARLKERTERQLYLLQNERNTCKKAFQQQRQRTAQTDQSLQSLTQKLQSSQLKQKQHDQSQQQLRQQLQQQQQQSQYRQNNIKKYYEDLLNNKNRTIMEELELYLRQLQQIRKDVQGVNVDEIVDEVERVGAERFGVERQIQRIRDENQRIIVEMKTRLIQQQQRIIQLEKDNEMLRTEIRQLQSQKQKLKKSMLQFDSIHLVTINNTTSTSTSINTTTNVYKNEPVCRLRTCLKQTIKKIDTLQHQISDILRE